VHQITIKDIARELKISPSTVSRALKDHPDINAETKKAVLEMAKKLDYQPNAIALGLRKSKTNIIGVIIPEIVHYFFSTVISGIEDVATELGYHVMICQSKESLKKEVAYTQALMSMRAEGILMSISKETDAYDHLLSLKRREIPLVFFDRAPNEIEGSRVVVDDLQGAFEATEHLIEKGCRNILHLKGPDHMSISRQRYNGYVQALEKYNIPYNPQLVITCGLKQNDGINAVRNAMDMGIKFDGIFAVADPVAIGAMIVLKEKGVKIPQEVAIVGFSDEQPVTSLIEPSLSTVSQPGYEMGVRAARLFFDEIANKETFKARKEILPTRVIVRDSSNR
jgi:LacI family transcriptional regulator